MEKITGVSLFDGYGFGTLAFDISENTSATILNEGLEKETEKYEKAKAQAIKETEELDNKPGLSKESKDIVEAHLMMLEDDDFNDLVTGALKAGKSAFDALSVAEASLSEMLKNSGDDYIAQRAADVKEVSDLIKAKLTGHSISLNFTKPTILVSNGLTVSQLLSLDLNIVKGLILVNIGKASHVAIVEKSLGIPAIIVDNVPNRAYDGKDAILNAIMGEATVDYNQDFFKEIRKDADVYAHKQALLKDFLNKPTLSKDGVKTTLYANIATPEEAALAYKSGAEGIGLFRSEFIYMNSADYPTEEEQFNEYKRAVVDMHGKPVVIRTFDIGSDKKASYFDLPKEENPALGYRSIRICYDRHDLFLTQLKALYRASAFGPLSIMIPMIISYKEIDFVHQMAKEAMDTLTKENKAFNKDMKIGIMVETPAAAIDSDILAQKAQFFSIGTNDLSQYTLAIDRTNENLAKFFNPHHIAILRLMKRTAEMAHKYGIQVSICGELAHDPMLLGFFLKIGIDHLSMSSSYILQTRQIISTIDVSKVNLKDFIGDF